MIIIFLEICFVQTSHYNAYILLGGIFHCSTTSIKQIKTNQTQCNLGFGTDGCHKAQTALKFLLTIMLAMLHQNRTQPQNNSRKMNMILM